VLQILLTEKQFNRSQLIVYRIFHVFSNVANSRLAFLFIVIKL